jgi:hypothetical protein
MQQDLLTTIQPEKRPLSVMLARDPEVLTTMLEFYAWPEARVLDVTANERRMWKGVNHPGGVTYADIDPAMNPDILADFRALPCEASSYDVIVFDPPHLPAAAASPESDQRFVGNYGLGHAPKGDNISPYFGPFLREASRVLTPEGLIFAKLKDFVHNHAYQWMLAEFIMAVKSTDGLTPCDLIVKRDPSAGSMMSSKWQKAHHARNAHCWWIVVRKGRCETRRKPTSALSSPNHSAGEA